MKLFKILLFLIVLAGVHWVSLYIGVEYPEWTDTIKVPIEKPWEKVNKPQPIRESQEDAIYTKAIPSVMWIVTNDGQASGVLIDKELRLAATNEHVTEGNVWVDVFFPVRDRNDRFIDKRHFYADQRNRGILHQLGYYTRGRVIAEDPDTDLAIVELDGLPETAREIDYNPNVPPYLFMNVDDPVYILGNPGGRDLWRPKAGHFQKFNKSQGVHIKADAYFGNSGGPVFNKNGALLGVLSRTNLDTMDTWAASIESIEDLRGTLEEKNIFSIKNDTTLPELPYYVKWTANGKWTLSYVKRGIPMNHWLIGQQIPQGYPKIRFDEIVNNGEFNERIWELQTHTRRIGSGVKPYSKADAREYHFTYDSKSEKLSLYLSKQ